MSERETRTFRVVAFGGIVEVIVWRHSFGWCVGEGLRNAVYDDPRDAVGEYAGRNIPGVEEVRAPGEATTAEALDAAVSGYRRGVAARVLDALAEARDAVADVREEFVEVDVGDGVIEVPKAGAVALCVQAIDDMIVRKVMQ